MDCQICDRPVADTGMVCHPCTDRLRDRLTWIAEAIPELDPVLARQTTHGTGTGRPSAETPLPLHLGAMEARRHVHAMLASWSIMTAEERGTVLPVDDTTALARHLSTQVEWLRHRDYAADAWEELHGCAERLRRAVDAPPSLTYLGPCGHDGVCGSDLRAVVGARHVTCPSCRTRHDVAERREANIEVCRDLLVDRSTIASILTAWGYPVPEATLRVWVSRGRLPRRGDRHRVGDALDLAVAWTARKSHKQSIAA